MATKITKKDFDMILQAAQAAVAAIGQLNKTLDESAPKNIASIIKQHAFGAVGCCAAGVVPGVGPTAAAVGVTGVIWRMYVKISEELGVNFSKNLIKSIASAVATNLITNGVVAIGVSTLLSFLPGIGTAASVIVLSAALYAQVMVAGFLYLKILASLYDSIEDPTTLSLDDALSKVEQVVQQEDTAALIKKAKTEYKTEKKD